MAKVNIVDDARLAASPVTAIYVRVTKEESVKKDLSLPNQRNRGIEMCGVRGWLSVKVYQEPRHVGGDLGPEKRPALAELLADIEAGLVERLLVRHTDRLWRAAEVENLILRALHRRSVELWDFHGPRELRSAGGRFALRVLGAAAEFEKGLTGERIREMKRGKALAGKVVGGPPPFGYSSQSRARREHAALGLSEDEAYRLACEKYPLARTWYLDEAEAAVVLFIFDLYLEKRWGARRISEELNRRGHRRRGGSPWSPVKVGNVINNPAVAGYTSFDEDAYERGLPSKKARFRQTLYAGTHPAIIPPERWHEAQRLKTEVNAKRIRTKGSEAARVFPLSGALRCGLCGSHMTGKSSGAARPAYYVCARRRYYGPVDGCGGPTVHQTWTEVTVWKYLDKLFQTPTLVAELFERTRRRVRQDTPELRGRLERLRAEVADLEAKQRRWMDRYESAKDDASADVIWTRVHELKTRQLAATREVEEIEQRLPGPAEPSISKDDLAAYLARLASLAQVSPVKRRALVELLEQHHDFRVQVIDERRLAVSFRLDGLAQAASPGAVGSRIVMLGRTAKAATRDRVGGGLRPMSPGSPMPGGPYRRTL